MPPFCAISAFRRDRTKKASEMFGNPLSIRIFVRFGSESGAGTAARTAPPSLSTAAPFGRLFRISIPVILRTTPCAGLDCPCAARTTIQNHHIDEKTTLPSDAALRRRYGLRPADHRDDARDLPRSGQDASQGRAQPEKRRRGTDARRNLPLRDAARDRRDARRQKRLRSPLRGGRGRTPRHQRRRAHRGLGACQQQPVESPLRERPQAAHAARRRTSRPHGGIEGADPRPGQLRQHRGQGRRAVGVRRGPQCRGNPLRGGCRDDAVPQPRGCRAGAEQRLDREDPLRLERAEVGRRNRRRAATALFDDSQLAGLGRQDQVHGRFPDPQRLRAARRARRVLFRPRRPDHLLYGP